MGSKQSKNQGSPPMYECIPEDWPWVWAISNPEHLDWKRGLTGDQIQDQSMQQSNLPVPITDNVYLGNAISVKDVALLESLGVTAVLNMAGKQAQLCKSTIKAYETRGIRYKRINAEDDENYNLLQNDWDEAFEFIKASTRDGSGKCVVNCVAGINRSGLIVAAYYMMTTQSNVLETVKHVRKQRGNFALCNESFQQQLVSMARMNNLLGVEPGEDGSIVEQQPPPAENDTMGIPTWMNDYEADERDNPLDRLASLY